ncbi:two-component system chemotaxis sensor kinase CheA [Paenibacillus forsythiae]|uniref:histidine kinase n=1 Tax=Paenibacillus forsythiae TaxID=365616 RepID=A0ABU3H690_9BACL|nr:CHASE3 domain-containing protein [Paenibacillus forsythiae]MDT3426338.1 two-component system chemotaxis sensor kinase CheA [Paenibacillus forsythiae]
MDKHVMNLKIRGKIALGYIMILVLLGLFLVNVQGRISELEKETVTLSGHDMQVHELTFQLEKNVLDMETGQRGYALTGNDSYLAPYYDGLEKWQVNFSNLKELVASSTSQVENLESIKRNIEAWIVKAGQYVVELKQAGHDKEVAAFFNADPGKAIVEQIRSEAQHFRDIEQAATAKRISDLRSRNQQLIVTMYILWSLVVAVALAASILITDGIVKTLKNVIAAINHIADGDSRARRIEVRTQDEISDLAAATNRLLEKAEREQRFSDQLTHMSVKLQEKTDPAALCDTFLSRLATILEIQYGAVYIAQDHYGDSLLRISSYAGGNEEISPAKEKIKLGEGLVGQCALDQNILKLEELPGDYIHISSGLGRTPPRQAVIAPVVFENRTVAVVEVASLLKWAPDHFKLLEQLLDLLAVSVNSVMTRMQIQHLYNEAQTMNEELQNQSEELQSQTHELINVNSKLETQKQIAENSAAELEKMNEELERSSRYKSEFLANMSHELRTPLNSMLLLSQILSENHSGNLTEEQLGYASVIHSSGSDLLAIINDILDLSKVEAGKMAIETSAVNLTEFPSLFEGYFGKTAESKNLEFSVVLQPGTPDIFYTDELRLHQILRNLLSNAFKFTVEGGVTLEISKLDTFAYEGYTPAGPVLAFAVTDTGIGIPPDKRDLIFEAFQQADGSTARKFGGTGLGLSISQQLTRLLGGHLTLNSTPQAGSTFTLYLPYLKEEPDPKDYTFDSEAEAALEHRPENSDAAKETPVNREYGLLSGRTVLLVDDDPRNIYALTQTLVKYGMHVLTAQNGFECLQRVRENPGIDILLLDIMMPVLDGYDTLSILREELLKSDLPIIAVSAKTMKEDREKCLAAGATDFIKKPVIIKDLLRLISLYLCDKAA